MPKASVTVGFDDQLQEFDKLKSAVTSFIEETGHVLRLNRISDDQYMQWDSESPAITIEGYNFEDGGRYLVMVGDPEEICAIINAIAPKAGGVFLRSTMKHDYDETPYKVMYYDDYCSDADLASMLRNKGII